MTDYEPVTRRGRAAGRAGAASKKAASKKEAKAASKKEEAPAALKPGHSLTYLCLFLFTILLYLRPSEI
ncbi:MAG TPA: hypothetical protein VE713_20695, partial [Pyrinomonadaceae bacterium]|nr:hypothetical protein [Pyrinomonadaceae bacterium]